LQFSDHFVCFLDVLGFKEKIFSIVGDDKKQNDFLSRYIEKVDKIVLQSAEIHSDFTTRVMSDSIVIACPVAKDKKFALLVDLIDLSCRIQSVLAESGFWVRGAISFGGLFINESHMIGDAIIKAYQLEENHALYPRVIIDPQIIAKYGGTTSFCSKVHDSKRFISSGCNEFVRIAEFDGDYIADDELVFLDYIEHFMNNRSCYKVLDIIDHLKVDFYKSPKIMKKLTFLRDYIHLKLITSNHVDQPENIKSSLVSSIKAIKVLY
jgi:hypothetical protein